MNLRVHYIGINYAVGGNLIFFGYKVQLKGERTSGKLRIIGRYRTSNRKKLSIWAYLVGFRDVNHRVFGVFRFEAQPCCVYGVLHKP